MRDPLPASESEPITIVGLGSPFGDDQVGWRVAEALRRRLPEGRARVLSLDRPGPALLDEIAGRHVAILIDGAVTGEPAGTLHRLDAAQVTGAAATRSSHGLGVGHALQLGRALGILPRRLELYLVSLEAVDTSHARSGLTPPVEAAAGVLVRRLERLLQGG